MSKTEQIAVNGKEVQVIHSSNLDGNIIDCTFQNRDIPADGRGSQYIGKISNFNGDFRGESDMMEKIIQKIQKQYQNTTHVIISRYVD